MTERARQVATDTSRRPLVIGHRGASGYRPEHSAAAYREAIAQGADAVEPDIVVSRDGVLLIRHETEISSTTDVASRAEFASRRTTKLIDGERVSGWFAEDFDWVELQTLTTRERLPELRQESAGFDGVDKILSLGELLTMLDTADRPITAVIELKHAASLHEAGYDLVQLLIADLTVCGWLDRPSQLVIESFDLTPLLRLRTLGIQAQTIFLLESEGAPYDQVLQHGKRAAQFSWYRSDTGMDWLRGCVDGISIAKRDLLKDPQIVARAHLRNLRVFVWTLRPENRFLSSEFRVGRNATTWGDWRQEWQHIVETGVDGVFVDHPNLMVELLQEIRPQA